MERVQEINPEPFFMRDADGEILMESVAGCDRASLCPFISSTAFVHFFSGTIHSISASFG